MSKTKHEVELEIRVKALEDVLLELEKRYTIEMPDLNYYRMNHYNELKACLLYTSPSPRDATLSRMPSSA